MSIYSSSTEETLHAHKLLKEWTIDGLLTQEQRDRLQQDTASDLRTTNIFLRLVLFFFTLIAVAACVGLFFVLFLSRPSPLTTGISFLIFAAISYAAAEVAVAHFRLHRYGIEEAFAVCSVALLCVGLDAFFIAEAPPYRTTILVLAAGVVSCLWVWYRFNLWYALPAAMIFIIFVPDYWTTSQAAQRSFIALLYAAGLFCIAPIRSSHRFTYLDDAYSLAEAFLCFGIYLAFNLKLTIRDLGLSLLGLGMPSRVVTSTQPALILRALFYWTTWVVIWCLPPLILARGIRSKDRLVIAAGAIALVLTLITNKPYLGWQRHTWDPMLLGIVLSGVSILLRRWLAQGLGGVRHGFTAAPLTGKDKRAMSVGSSVLGVLTPQAITPAPQTHNPDFKFGGGSSGGGGASGDY